jgi:hypothetical protein
MMIGQILRKRRPVVEAVETEKPPIALTIPVPVACALLLPSHRMFSR